MTRHDPRAPEIVDATLKTQLLEFIGHHRQALMDSLEGLTEEEARRRLVPSKTTLLGLVKHATFAETVWFEETRTGASRASLGIVTSVDESFDLEDADTIESVLSQYRRVVAASERIAAASGLDEIWTHHRLGRLPVRWILLHLLRELAQHCGHADILREQILASRTA